MIVEFVTVRTAIDGTRLARRARTTRNLADRYVAHAMSDDIKPDTKDWTWVLERAVPGVRLRRRDGRRDASAGAVRANAAPWQEVLARPDVAAGRAGRVVAARVRLPRPRRVPAVRPAAGPDADRGRPAVRQLGPGRDGRRRAVRRRRTRRRSPTSCRRPPSASPRRSPLSRATSGRGPGGAATARSSRSTRSPATSCTIRCTTSTTSGRPQLT